MSLKGKVICITGTLPLSRNEIVDVIQKNGGEIAASVTKKVTHLICANPTQSTTKLDKARSMGVNVVGPEFISQFLPTGVASANASANGNGENDEIVSTVKKSKTSATTSEATKIKKAAKPKETTEKKEPKEKKPKATKTAKKVNSTDFKKITVRSGDKTVIEEVEEFITLMTESNSNLEKKNVFKQYVEQASEDLVRLLKMIYNKQSKFHITPKNVLKYEETKYDENQYVESDIVEFCTNLEAEEISGHEALQVACSILSDNKEHRDTVLTIFDKDLKIRFGLNLVNDTIPNFVSVFNVSLGNAFNEKTKECTSVGEWFISKKLDGVRCITFIRCNEDGTINNIQGFSRGGHEFKTLAKVHEDIRKNWAQIYAKVSHLGNNIVLDGEMCVINEDGSENFRSIVSEIKKKNYTVDKPRYLVFDLLTEQEFRDELSARTFAERVAVLRSIFPSYETNLKKFITSDSSHHLSVKGIVETQTIQMLPQLPFTEEMFGAMSGQAEKQGWEGLMLRKDTPYQGKRSNDLLKVKQFETEEYKVEDVVFGPIMIINEDTGLQETIEALVSVVINHTGLNTYTNTDDVKVINVGSGFSQQERVEFYNHPDRIKGKTISVQYFETIRSKDGKESLRFPTFKGIHGNKRVL